MRSSPRINPDRRAFPAFQIFAQSVQDTFRLSRLFPKFSQSMAVFSHLRVTDDCLLSFMSRLKARAAGFQT